MPNSIDKLFLNNLRVLLSVGVFVKSENKFILTNVDHNIHITSKIIITDAILSLLAKMLLLLLDNTRAIDIKNTIKKIDPYIPKEEIGKELFCDDP